MTLVPVIDDLACSAHGDCAAVAPEVFAIGDIAEVIGSGPPDLLFEAARACPAVAIAIVDDATGEQHYP